MGDTQYIRNIKYKEHNYIRQHYLCVCIYIYTYNCVHYMFILAFRDAFFQDNIKYLCMCISSTKNYKNNLGKPEGKRPLGRPRHR